MSQPAQGVLAMIAACTIWGLSPLYYKLVAHVPPLEVLAHRTLWSFVFFVGVLLLQKRLAQLAPLLRSRQAGPVALAAVMISVNWFLFIYSIQVDRALEASLGYYIFPLVAVLLGRVAFGERLSPVQLTAVALAGLAVSVLTIGLGVFPLISMVLATTFGLYGLVKKRLEAGPIVSVTAEVLLLTPLALAWLAWLHGQGTAQATDMRDLALLIASGPLTAGPLILFSLATKRVKMATVGVIQYLNPTLQFACAVLVFAEPFTQWHAIAFPMIWLALALYSLSALLSERAARKARASSGTS